MLFNSLEFLIFLPLVFAGYWFVFRKRDIQNVFIIAASYFFYGMYDWRFLFLIFLTTVSCFVAGRIIDISQIRSIRRLACGVNVVLNLTILCYFKYYNFFTDNLKLLFEQFGYQLDWFTLDVLLPVGISFYTFQAISYPIDVYRNNIQATKDFTAFMAFISFFPQLVAGPIERSTNLLPQFERSRHFDYNEAVDGMRRILWGFFKKVVIADNCAFFANKVFSEYSSYNTSALWIGAFFFTFQIYGDFSGYSDIAIGTAKLFGIRLKMNFHFPYFSRDIAEFWRRWHISLNTWFRDYVYIPLGGSRCRKVCVIRNIMIIFLLSGLWHGANWTFVAWGCYHALLFLPIILMGRNRRHINVVSDSFIPKPKVVLEIVITFVLVMIGWVMFRADDFVMGIDYISRCFYYNNGISAKELLASGRTIAVICIVSIAILQFLDWTQRNKEYGLQIVESMPRAFRWMTYTALSLFVIYFSGTPKQFIYFQF